MRKDVREAVLKVLYAREINPESSEGLKKFLFRKLSAEEVGFADGLMQAVDAHEEEILRMIDENIRNFKKDRLFPVDRAVLMIAVAEILYFDDIPPVVSVSEATDLAQKYSTEKSADFVNGVLSGVIANV